jgi:hypothetical protein
MEIMPLDVTSPPYFTNDNINMTVVKTPELGIKPVPFIAGS